MNSPPDMMMPRCEVLTSPNQAREVLETSGRAEQVALDVDAHVSGAYGESDVTLSLSVEASSGDITLRLAE
jgi:hypothetical protein